MIDFRYHLVSIIAVFLALALGLFIGSTSLQNTVVHNIQGQVGSLRSTNQKLSSQNAAQQQQLKNDDSFITALGPYAVGSRLSPLETVTIVSLPGVDPSLVDAVASEIHAAGGTVASRVQLQPAFSDPSSQAQALLTELATRLKPQGVRLPVGGNGSERAAAELAAVLGTKPGRTPVPAARMQSVLSAFSDAHVLSLTGSVGNVRPASLAVLLAPAPGQVSAPDRPALATVTTAMARDFAQTSVGSVLAGPLPAAAPNGLLQAERAVSDRPGNLATVQSVDTTGGQVAVVFALVEVYQGRSGDFGPGSATPLPSPPSAGP